jgi:hypothetical protein
VTTNHSTATTLFPTPLAVLAKVLAAKAEGASLKVLKALDAEFNVAVLVATTS